MDRDHTDGESRATEEFAEAVRGEAARFFDAIVQAVEEEIRRNPELGHPRPGPVPEKEAAALAVESVREVRQELWSSREPEAPSPSPGEIEEWEIAREHRRKQEGYEPH